MYKYRAQRGGIEGDWPTFTQALELDVNTPEGDVSTTWTCRITELPKYGSRRWILTVSLFPACNRRDSKNSDSCCCVDAFFQIVSHPVTRVIRWAGQYEIARAHISFSKVRNIPRVSSRYDRKLEACQNPDMQGRPFFCKVDVLGLDMTGSEALINSASVGTNIAVEVLCHQILPQKRFEQQ
jgi:hypothetical protein